MRFHLRRTDKEITDPAIMKKIMRSTHYVTLAMSMDNEPYLVSLSHGYDETRNCVYFHCASEGKKIVYLRSNNSVWGQAVLDRGYAEGKCTHFYASVHFSGKVTFLRDPEEKRHALECVMRQLDKEPEPLIKQLSREGLAKVAIGRIDLEYMSGKKSAEVTI